MLLLLGPRLQISGAIPLPPLYACIGMSWGDLHPGLGLDVKFTADLHWLLSMRGETPALAYGSLWCSVN